MIACALFTPFALWHAHRLEPGLEDESLVVLKKNKVTEVSDSARRAGIELGMSLDGARSRCSDLVIVEANDLTLQHTWDEVLSRLYAFTNRIEPVKPGVVFLDITEADTRLVAAIFQARVALADNQEHAHLKALAHVTEKPAPEKSREASAIQHADVKEIPITVLREVGLGKKNVERLHWLGEVGLGKKNVERLHWLGVATVGDLQRWSKAQLASFFGKESAMLIPYLKGPYRTSVTRYRPPVTLEASYARPSLVRRPCSRVLAARDCPGTSGRSFADSVGR